MYVQCFIREVTAGSFSHGGCATTSQMLLCLCLPLALLLSVLPVIFQKIFLGSEVVFYVWHLVLGFDSVGNLCSLPSYKCVCTGD